MWRQLLETAAAKKMVSERISDQEEEQDSQAR